MWSLSSGKWVYFPVRFQAEARETLKPEQRCCSLKLKTKTWKLPRILGFSLNSGKQLLISLLKHPKNFKYVVCLARFWCEDEFLSPDPNSKWTALILIDRLVSAERDPRQASLFVGGIMSACQQPHSQITQKFQKPFQFGWKWWRKNKYISCLCKNQWNQLDLARGPNTAAYHRAAWISSKKKKQQSLAEQSLAFIQWSWHQKFPGTIEAIFHSDECSMAQIWLFCSLLLFSKPGGAVRQQPDRWDLTWWN